MSPALEASKKTFGECTIAFEPPNILVTVLAGELTEAVIAAMYAEYRRLDGRASPFYSLVGLQGVRLTTMASSVRQLAITHAEKLSVPAGVVIYGGNYQLRAIFSFFFRAQNLFLPRFSKSPVRYFATEAEARAWIAERRRVERLAV